MSGAEPTTILLFSRKTRAGLFTITTVPDTFTITLQTYGCKYQLCLDGFVLQTVSSPYDAVRAVAGHQTGSLEWDTSEEKAPDYIRHWTCHVDKKFKMRLLGDCLDCNVHQSYRAIVDYFEHKHSYIMDRSVIKDLLEELAVTGQLDKLPSDDWVPAELRHFAKVAKKWQETDKGQGE